MNYLLDTDICINILKKNPIPLKKLVKLKKANVFISSITEAELWYGVWNSTQQDTNAQSLKQFLIPFDRLPFSSRDAEAYGEIRSDLKTKGKMIGSNDLFIASQAISNNLVLVTGNEKEFKRVKGIKLENWMISPSANS